MTLAHHCRRGAGSRHRTSPDLGPAPARGHPRTRRALAAFVAAYALAASALAAALPSDELELRCWLAHTRERTKVNLKETTAVEFSNLRAGMEVRAPFTVDFAIRGMGVAPAGVRFDGTGHHHILVNRSLPINTTDKLPFDDSHRHFGKGQTGTLLDLPAGRHRLRLLFADHEHRPYFVFSREIEVTVRGPRSTTARPKIDASGFERSCAAWYADELSAPPPPDEPLRILNVRAGEPLVSPFNLRLGANGAGICASGAKADPKGGPSGHFLLDILDGRSRQPVQNFKLTNGATQVNVFIGAGEYVARLRLVGADGSNVLPPHELALRVVRQESL